MNQIQNLNLEYKEIVNDANTIEIEPDCVCAVSLGLHSVIVLCHVKAQWQAFLERKSAPSAICLHFR